MNNDTLVRGLVARISAAWGRSLAGIIEAGHLLQQLKDTLPHGQWMETVKVKLPFSCDTAGRLMKIASHEVISTRILRSFCQEALTLCAASPASTKLSCDC